MNKVNVRWATALFLVVVISTNSGCEALRKKFIRKKKADVEENQPIAILDPIDYPAKIKSVAESYKEHYSLWKVWQSDLENTIDDNTNEKKIRYTLGQLKEQLVEMKRLLTEDLQKEMDLLLFKVDTISAEYEKSMAFRNKSLISSEIRAIDRTIKNHFAPDKIKDHLAAL